MFPPENDEGNIEYKRHLWSNELKSFDTQYNIRFQQLITQMKYRLGEGNGIAVYYIGIEDDGSIYDITKEERHKSIIVIKKMVLHINAVIDSIIFNKNYVKIVIKDKLKLGTIPEKRILLLGDTESGKTTFLAYIIKNKLDTDSCKARLYILNHKHEIENGKTTSFNCQYRDYENKKYVFIDTPGDDVLFSKSNRIRNKILLSFDYDLILFFNKPNNIWIKKEMFIKYAEYNNIPFLDINLFNEESKINLINPIKQLDIMDYFEKNIKKKSINLSNSLTNFYLLKSFPHSDMGWILSGFLSCGELHLDQELYWYDYDMVPVKINSIYKNNIPVNKINGPSTITITLKEDCLHKYMINNKPRFGFLSNINYIMLKHVKLKWIYYNDPYIKNEKYIYISVSNQNINLRKIEDSNMEYDIINPDYSFNLINKIFIYESKDYIGFGKIIL